MKQKTRISYWFLLVILSLLFGLVACIRPAPESTESESTSTPVVQPTVVEMPTEIPSSPTPLPETSNPTPGGEGQETENGTDPNAGGEATAVPAALPANHTVQEGETLASISQQYGVSQEEIAAANNITTSSALTAGQVLTIPEPGTVAVQPQPPDQTQPSGEQTHVVQPGENLFRISLRYGKTVEEVAAYNGIANPHYIYPGQVIKIP